MRALITGGAGFIGLHLASALADDGAELLVTDLPADRAEDPAFSSLIDRPNVRWQPLDLLAADAAAALTEDFAPTHLFHLAARLGVQDVQAAPYRTLTDNVALLSTALRLARASDELERFVFASTSEVYAGALLHLELPLPTPEDTPLALPDLAEPRSAYMLSKLCGEAMVRHAGLPSFVIVRPHNVYGPRMGMRHVIPQLMARARRLDDAGPLDVFSIEHRRAFCYVSDAVAMLIAAATAPGAHDAVLNLGSEAPEIAMGELGQAILRTMDRQMPIRPLAPHTGSPARRCPAMGRMTEATGVVAQVGLEEGLARTWAWYRDNAFS